MNQIINRQIQLSSRPQGKPKTEDLKLVEEELNETLDKIKDAVKEAEEKKTKATEESVDQATEEASTTSQPA